MPSSSSVHLSFTHTADLYSITKTRLDEEIAHVVARRTRCMKETNKDYTCTLLSNHCDGVMIISFGICTRVHRGKDDNERRRKKEGLGSMVGFSLERRRTRLISALFCTCLARGKECRVILHSRCNYGGQLFAFWERVCGYHAYIVKDNL